MTNLPPVQELSEERGMTTKPLEWREYEVDGETAMWEASTNFGTFYLIDAKPDHFELSHNHEPLGIFPAPEDAKIAADADHLCRILPALTELQHSRAAEAVTVEPRTAEQLEALPAHPLAKWKGGLGKKGLGHFDDELAAAHAYDRAAIQFHGEFATLNFPEAK